MAEDITVDSTVFEQFRAGDHGAMTAIVRLYHKRLIGFVRVYTRNREMAEEIAQEVFLSAFLQRREIRKAEGLRPWLFTVAKRKAIREMDRRNRRGEVSVGIEDLSEISPSVGPEQGDRVLYEQTEGHLQRVMERLKPRDQELLALRYFGGLQVKEIAQVMEIPMGSVGVFLNRSLAKVRKLLEQQGIQPEDLIGR